MASKLETVVDDLVAGRDETPNVKALSERDILLLILEILAKRLA